jgi:multidrug efflux system membrane fusion protein
MQTITLRQLSWLAGFILTLTALVGCEAQGEETAAALPPAPEVEVVEIQSEEVLLWGSFTGRIAAPQTVDLRPRVSGYIRDISFIEGDLVQEGDVLFQIDPRPYAAREQLAQAELARAKSQLQLAESEAKRAEQLWQKRAISREEFDQRNAAFSAAKAALDATSAELASAQLNLQYTQITAPISGRIGRAHVTSGNLASADATVLANIVSVNPLYVYFESDQASAAGIGASASATEIPVRVKHQNQSPQSQSTNYATGHLDFIDNHYDRDTGTLQFRAVIDNTDGLFKPGQFARIEMPVGEASATLLVDDKAVLTDQDRRYVYVVNADNTVARRYVELGRQFNGSRVVTAGLQDGDTVVVNGLQRIAFPGMEVSPQVVASSSQTPSPVLADSRR